MKIPFILLFAILFNTQLSFAQQDSSKQMTLLFNWDVDTFPQLSGVYFNDCWGYVDCEGNEYAIIGSIERIHFFDITDPENANEIASFEGGGQGLWRDFKTYRDRAYAVADGTSEGLLIFDLSNIKDTITQTYQNDTIFSRSHNIFIDEPNGRLYVVGANGADIYIFDIATDPDNPILIGSPPLPGGGYIHDIYVRDHIAYCSHGYNGFYIWNMENAENPELLGLNVTGGYNHSSWVTDDGNYAIYAEEVPIGLPLGVMDLSKLDQNLIEIATTFKFPLLAPEHTQNRPHNPYIRGNYLITSYYHDGVQIFDISDPLNPKQQAFYDTFDNTDYPNNFKGCWGVYPYLPSGNIIASDVERGLLILRADSIDFQSVEVTTFPDPSIEVDGILPLCEGVSSVTLHAVDGAEIYTWYKDGEFLATGISELQVDEAGMYSLEVSNGHCSQFSEEIEVIVNPVPDLSGFPTAAIQLCGEEEILVEGPQGFDFYIWMRDGMVVSQTSSVEIDQAGNYTLTVFKDGCNAVSPAIPVTVQDLPDVSLDVSYTQPALCPDKSVLFEVAAGADSYEWYLDGNLIFSDTNRIEITTDGNYQVKVNSNDCEAASIVVPITYFTPVVPVIEEVNGTLISSSAVSYQWFLNGMLIPGATSQEYTYTESGNYTVETTDSNSCQVLSDPAIIIFTNVQEQLGASELTIYPIPANDLVHIQAEFPVARALELQLMSLEGKLLMSQSLPANSNQRTTFELAELAAGLYLLSIESDQGRIVRKLVVE